MSGVRVPLPDGSGEMSLPAVQSVAACIVQQRGGDWNELADSARLKVMGQVLESYTAIAAAHDMPTVPALRSGWRRVLLSLAGIR